jgi:paraquat-inducible protein A
MATTLKQAGLCRCEHCATISALPGDSNANTKHRIKAICPRCGATLHSRRPYSLQKCWALLISAAILLLPANLLPMMTIVSFGSGQPDTIMSGIIKLAKEGLWGIAAIVFIASIIVPLFKLISLSLLLLAVHFHLPLDRQHCQRLFRLISFIGRWSMLDIFVIAVLISVVSFGQIASVETGMGASCFGLAVVLTLFATEAFDTRLIWDLEHE